MWLSSAACASARRCIDMCTLLWHLGSMCCVLHWPRQLRAGPRRLRQWFVPILCAGLMRCVTCRQDKCRQDSCRQAQGSSGSPGSPCQACWACGSPLLLGPGEASTPCAGPAARAAAACWTDHLEGAGPGRQSVEGRPAPRWLACCHASTGRPGGGMQACGCCRRWGQARSKQSLIPPAAPVCPDAAVRRCLRERLHCKLDLPLPNLSSHCLVTPQQSTQNAGETLASGGPTCSSC